ncbi:hypothetical protein Acr_23g0011640 [Actinidia rufa]|uniref:Uncharacterized protein n=1 Tax=Actinidia rufa TaxID=165716 RepID=A0A7J0GPQ4_9ERIC|nr:hypothetical protein Acr_23g0011640 [Actinidia rufa]
MANQLYGYNPSSGGGSIYGGGASNVYSSRSSVADIYLSADSSLSRYLSADRSSSLSDRGIGSPMLFSQSDALRFSSSSARVPGIGVTQTSWPGVDVGASSSDPLVSGIKRPSECKALLVLCLYISSSGASPSLLSPCGFYIQFLVLSSSSKEIV